MNATKTDLQAEYAELLELAKNDNNGRASGSCVYAWALDKKKDDIFCNSLVAEDLEKYFATRYTELADMAEGYDLDINFKAVIAMLDTSELEAHMREVMQEYY